MRLPSSCSLIAGTVSIPRLPALLGACQFFMAHVTPCSAGRPFFQIEFFSKISQLPNFFQKLPTAIYFIFLHEN
jgi:hypothetical protein